MQALGAVGVGQSSWGPTLFAVLPDETTAEQFGAELQQHEPDVQIAIAASCNTGATLRHVPS